MEKEALLQMAENQETIVYAFNYICFAELKDYKIRSEKLLELILVF